MYQDLDDIIFEDRHKAYGAYAFRKHYGFTLTKALVVGIFLFSVLFFIPISFIKTQKKTAANSEKIIPIDLTEMRINYGDNRNGKGLEEPKEEEGSPAPVVEKNRRKKSLPKLQKLPRKKSKKIFLKIQFPSQPELKIHL